MGPHALERDPAPSKVDGGKEHEGVQNEEAGDVGDGARGPAGAGAVDESVGGDTRSRRERQEHRARAKVLAPARERQARDRGGDEDDGEERPPAQGLAEEWNRGAGDEEGRHTPRYGIDEGSRPPSRVEKQGVVRGVAENVPREIGSDGEARKTEGGKEWERNDASGEVEGRELHERVPARLDESIPGGVHHRREQDEERDPEAQEGLPPRSTRTIPARVRAIPGTWRETSDSFQMRRE
jgi:hypothetical protein